MIRKAAQQVWHQGWTANLSDTSNTKVTFPNSWKYRVSFWWLTAFSFLVTDLSPSSHEFTFPSWPSGNYHIVHDGRKGPAAQLSRPCASPTVPQLWETDTYTMGSWFLVTPSVECACLSLCHTGLSEEYCDCNLYIPRCTQILMQGHKNSLSICLQTTYCVLVPTIS